MPAGGAWGTFNPYTYQQQHSTGRGWGAGGSSRPPMPYGGHGAQYPSGGGYRSSYGREYGGRAPYGGQQKGYRAPSGGGRGGGGIGGSVQGGGAPGWGRYGFSKSGQKRQNIWDLGMAGGMAPAQANYLAGMPGYQMHDLLANAGWGGGINEFLLSQNPMFGGLGQTFQQPWMPGGGPGGQGSGMPGGGF